MVDKVLTANRLTDGIAVWLNANGQWVTSLQEALVARHTEAVDALEADLGAGGGGDGKDERAREGQDACGGGHGGPL